MLPYGGTEYLSTSTFEHCTVEEMCDFFNCDDTRASWDRLLYRHRVLERDERTGAEVVFWERALPVISNRDYVFSRRTWKERCKDGSDVYWAINKGCTHSQSPETPKVKRVDPYFSAWRMRAVPGRDGRLTSAECLLSHFEEQHVNQDVARFAVKCGMWGVVKNMDMGFRKYQRKIESRAAASADAAAAAAGASSNGGSSGAINGGSSPSGATNGDAGENDANKDGKGRGRLRRLCKIALGGALAVVGAKIVFGGAISVIGVLATIDPKARRGRGGPTWTDRGSGKERGGAKPGARRRHGQPAGETPSNSKL